MRRGRRMHPGTQANFGELLRRYRTAAGLTQEQLAERAGLSARALSDLERGLHRVPQRDTVRRLVEVLDLGPAKRAELVAARASRVLPDTRTRQTESFTPQKIAHPLTSFIGRAQELDEINRLLENARLLTLAGPGGVGKTRLALETARAVGADFSDGVAMVQLAALTDPTLVPQVVAQALGLRERPGSSPTDVPGQILGSRTLLLILDNCEHLVDACADLTEALLPSCPGLRILATSREPLRISGERVWRVPALALPEAQRLFLERAQALGPVSLTPDEHATSDVAEICRRLDGIPLAIELAAALVPVLSFAQIATRLDDRLRLLVRGARTAPPRHQMLRATIDWSY